MPTPFYALTMARYNLWQNASLLAAANTLSGADRQADRGAFFGSIERTFFHLLWGDSVWISRFAGLPMPGDGLTQSGSFAPGWDGFGAARATLDRAILHWASGLDPDWFEGAAPGGRPRGELVMHMFNHQTHHRGQIHAMLTAAGARPGVTDLFLMPEDFRALPG